MDNPPTAVTDLPALPALKSLGKLADLRPTVIVDSREQSPLPISRLPLIRAGLQSGDYSFVGGEQLGMVGGAGIGGKRQHTAARVKGHGSRLLQHPRIRLKMTPTRRFPAAVVPRIPQEATRAQRPAGWPSGTG